MIWQLREQKTVLIWFSLPAHSRVSALLFVNVVQVLRALHWAKEYHPVCFPQGVKEA